MTTRAVLAYAQAADYKKGQGTKLDEPIPPPVFSTLTRLGTIINVRPLDSDGHTRYYIDIQLDGYPYDPKGTTGNAVLEELRVAGSIPMRTFVALWPGNSAKALFNTSADDQAYSQVIDRLSVDPSQFAKDTFWRLKTITSRTKSLFPLKSTKESNLAPVTGDDGELRFSYFSVTDQTTLTFRLQFYRGKAEHGPAHRARLISVEGSPKSSADLVQSKFLARSFGQAAITVPVPATTSLSQQSARFRIITELHADDEQKVYPYGPQLTISVRYRKSKLKSLMAIVSIMLSSGLFAWAVFSTSVFASTPCVGYVVPLPWRVGAVIAGVLLSLYAYYLWNDDVSLDKARRS